MEIGEFMNRKFSNAEFMNPKLNNEAFINIKLIDEVEEFLNYELITW